MQAEPGDSRPRLWHEIRIDRVTGFAGLLRGNPFVGSTTHSIPTVSLSLGGSCGLLSLKTLGHQAWGSHKGHGPDLPGPLVPSVIRDTQHAGTSLICGFDLLRL